tara:strand:- start:3549 stop:3650 length:102 start_codon:yes stop_codon:yes gene_type:complete
MKMGKSTYGSKSAKMAKNGMKKPAMKKPMKKKK